MIIVKNAQNTSENTEKDTLGCKEIRLQKYIIVCLLLATCTYNKKILLQLIFPLKSSESNQNDENCNRKQYSVIEIENIWLAIDVTTSLNISSNLKTSCVYYIIPLLKRTGSFTC